MEDRRTHARFPGNDVVTVLWAEYSGILTQYAVINNLSMAGISISLVHNLPINTKVTIIYEGDSLSGVVRHNSARDDRYHLGIEFSDPDENESAVLTQSVEGCV